MKIITRSACGLARDERGLTTVEYAIVLCLIAALAVGAWHKFGTNVNNYLTGATNTIDSEMPKQEAPAP
jgi:Flp pilus assembly pilin Flp